MNFEASVVAALAASPLVGLMFASLGGPADAQARPPLDRGHLLGAMGLQNGRWHSTLAITDVQISPADPNGTLSPSSESARQNMRRQMETDDCLGDGLAADGSLILPGIGIAPACALSTIDAAGGRLHLVSQCGQRERGFESHTTVDASYAPTTMTSHIVSTVYSEAEGGTVMRLAVTIHSSRTGQCG